MTSDFYSSIVEFDRSMPWAKSVAAALAGVLIGSFLNVLALRSLKEGASILHPRSHCPACEHSLAAGDLIPILSYFLLKGKCRYCSARIAWYYPFVEAVTGLTFVLVLLKFGWNWTGLGMLFFSSTLIAVTITDFKEKLIPHEITYPAILIGLLFTGTVSRGIIPPDTSAVPPIYSALSGIGVSYILFDLLAFYGLKVYHYHHRNDREDDSVEWESGGEAQPAAAAQPPGQDEADEQIDFAFSMAGSQVQELEEEEIEVMGGGDAVLAALIAAWLGLDNLFVCLIVGFLCGAVMGGLYLGHAMWKNGALGEALRPAMVCIGVACGVVSFFLLVLYNLSPNNALSPLYCAAFLGLAVIFGGVVGVINSGKRFSQPFPFGPALVVGAVVAICLLSNLS